MKIDTKFVRSVESATQGIDLHAAVQNAIQLEHSTVPPYLLAAYSLLPGANSAARRTLIAIAKEEMLHMAIACNVLNALGGRPQIGGPDFTPKYPDRLPMSIGDGLVVDLEATGVDLPPCFAV